MRKSKERKEIISSTYPSDTATALPPHTHTRTRAPNNAHTNTHTHYVLPPYTVYQSSCTSTTLITLSPLSSRLLLFVSSPFLLSSPLPFISSNQNVPRLHADRGRPRPVRLGSLVGRDVEDAADAVEGEEGEVGGGEVGALCVLCVCVCVCVWMWM